MYTIRGNRLQRERRDMATTRKKMSEVIAAQPDNESCEEIMRKVALDRMIERGPEDSRSGRTISNNEMAQHICTWQK